MAGEIVKQDSSPARPVPWILRGFVDSLREPGVLGVLSGYTVRAGVRVRDGGEELSRRENAEAASAERRVFDAGRKAGLDVKAVKYILEWVAAKGVHWLACDGSGADGVEGNILLRDHRIRTVINALADEGLCVGTCASREEVQDFLSQRMRNPVLPESLRESSADKLAKMMGYYPGGGEPGGTNIQINLVNPYGGGDGR